MVMKEVSGIGKGIFNLCKAYLQWANQVGENHKVPEKLLNEMIRKGQFKSVEDGERATKITIKLVLFSAPVIFLLILTLSIIPKSANQSVAVKTTESSTLLSLSNLLKVHAPEEYRLKSERYFETNHKSRKRRK